MPNQFKDIPLPGDLLSVSQGDLKGNFDYIQGALGKDHQIVFNDTDTGTSFEGRHKQVSLDNQTVAAVQTAFTDGAQVALFSLSGNLAVTFSTYPALAATLLTLNSKPPSALANGYSWLPGGMLIQWGTNAAPGNGAGVQGFPTAFPTACFVVLVTEKRTGSPSGVDQVYVQAKTTANFTYFTTTSGAGFASFDWIAIGN